MWNMSLPTKLLPFKSDWGEMEKTWWNFLCIRWVGIVPSAWWELEFNGGALKKINSYILVWLGLVLKKMLVFLVLLTLYVKMSMRGCQLKLKKKKKSQVISQKTEGFSYSVLPFLLLSVLDAIFMQPQGNRNHKGIIKKPPTLWCQWLDNACRKLLDLVPFNMQKNVTSTINTV